MPKQVTLVGCTWQVGDGIQQTPDGPQPVKMLMLTDPADGTTYMIPWDDVSAKRLVAALTGIVIAPANGHGPG